MADLNSHVVSGGELTAMMGDNNYLPWSFSRMEAAEACLYKFKRIYLDGVKETSNALTLGSLAHEVIALLLEDRTPSLEKAKVFLYQTYPAYKYADPSSEILNEVLGLLPYMVEFTDSWLAFTEQKQIQKYRVEHPYGLKEDFTRCTFKNGAAQLYFRGIVDLWAYDSRTKTIYVIDHKTNKSALSKNAVHEHRQLNVYVAMLAAIYNLKWEKAVIGLNFLRKGKVVWSTVCPEEVEEFSDKFRNTLHYLENELYDCENSMIWPTKVSFKCNWCTFKSTCDAYQANKARKETTKK